MSTGRNLLFAGAAAVGLYAYGDDVYRWWQGNTEEVPITTFLNNVDESLISSVTINGLEVVGTSADGETTYVTQTTPNLDLVSRLENANIAITVETPSERSNLVLRAILNLIVWGSVAGIAMTGLKKAFEGVGGDISERFKLGKPKAENVDVTFDDVAGIDEVQEEMQELVDFLKDPATLQKFNAKTPKGVLLVGPPGTGKTLISKALAGEADVPFFALGATDFSSPFQAVGKDRVKEVFAEAKKEVEAARKAGKKNATAIIFIDEIDAFGENRNQPTMNKSHKEILTQFLIEMDGFDGSEGVLIVAATNRQEVLGPALLRPGRFDRQVEVPLPLEKGRHDILAVHTKKKSLAKDVDIKDIASHTRGFSGADLANLVNEAAIHASRRKDGTNVITNADFESARDRITMGTQRNLTISPKEQYRTCIHEAGHTICGLEKEADGVSPVHKVTAVPRGNSLGVTMFKPEEEKYGMSVKEFKAQLVIAFGGRIAEELMFGPDDISNGASGDIQQATELAWTAITNWGFSDELGRVLLGKGSQGHLGGSSRIGHGVNDNTAKEIQDELRKIIKEAEDEARTILTKNADDLLKLSNALWEDEDLDRQEILDLLGREDLEPETFSTPQTTSDFKGISLG